MPPFQDGVLGGFVLFKSGNSAVLGILRFVLTLMATFVARVGSDLWVAPLLAYAFAALISVLIIMFLPMRGGWDTHYDVLEARFAAAPLLTKFF